MSLTLFNKLVNIINDQPLDNTQTISGGVMLGETIDNLVGGSQLNENGKRQSTPIVPKELNENLFEGGDQCSEHADGLQLSEGIGVIQTGDHTGDNNNEDNHTGDTDDNYTMFLHRLKTKELYTNAVGGGKTTKGANSLRPLEEVNDDETTNINVLPMFPYLVRY